jgi:hypothetical protein
MRCALDSYSAIGNTLLQIDFDFDLDSEEELASHKSDKKAQKKAEVQL